MTVELRALTLDDESALREAYVVGARPLPRSVPAGYRLVTRLGSRLGAPRTAGRIGSSVGGAAGDSSQPGRGAQGTGRRGGTHGDLGWSPAPVTAGEYQDELSLWRAQGRTLASRSRSTSEVTSSPGRAWSSRRTPLGRPRCRAPWRGSSTVGGGSTARSRSRRGRAQPDDFLARSTSSEDRNVWMRAINDEIGFVPVESEILFQKPRTEG